jgi:hypothetical protein
MKATTVNRSPFPTIPRGKRFVSLATFRPSGEPVATPLWFGWSEQGIVVITPANAAKVKRIRRDPRVTVAPCRSQGAATGSTAPGRARFLDDAAERAAAGRAIARRYPVPRRVLDWSMRRRGHGESPVYLEIVPV